jgi:hypothetical protein
MISLSEIWGAIEGRVLALIHKTEARGARAYRSTTQSINNTSLTALSWDTEVYDTDGCWDVGTPTHLTAARDGYYMAGGSIYMTAATNNAASAILLYVRKNGTTILQSNAIHTIAGKLLFLEVTAGMFWLSAGDYVEVLIYHDEGGAKNVEAATATTHNANSGWLMRVS